MASADLLQHSAVTSFFSMCRSRIGEELARKSAHTAFGHQFQKTPNARPQHLRRNLSRSDDSSDDAARVIQTHQPVRPSAYERPLPSSLSSNARPQTTHSENSGRIP